MVADGALPSSRGVFVVIGGFWMRLPMCAPDETWFGCFLGNEWLYEAESPTSLVQESWRWWTAASAVYNSLDHIDLPMGKLPFPRTCSEQRTKQIGLPCHCPNRGHVLCISLDRRFSRDCQLDCVSTRRQQLQCFEVWFLWTKHHVRSWGRRWCCSDWQTCSVSSVWGTFTWWILRKAPCWGLFLGHLNSLELF